MIDISIGKKYTDKRYRPTGRTVMEKFIIFMRNLFLNILHKGFYNRLIFYFRMRLEEIMFLKMVKK